MKVPASVSLSACSDFDLFVLTSMASASLIEPSFSKRLLPTIKQDHVFDITKNVAKLHL